MRKTKIQIINVLLLLLAGMLIFSVNAFGASTALSVTKAKMGTVTLKNATEVGPVKLKESIADAFSLNGRYVTFTIPLNVKLAGNGISGTTGNTGNAFAQTEPALGSKDTPKDLKIKANGSAGTVYITSGGSDVSLLEVYGQSTTSTLFFGDPAFANGTQHPAIVEWGTGNTLSASTASEKKVGQIFYSATDGVKITLAAMGMDDKSYLEEFWLNKLALFPTAANTTGDVTLKSSDGDASGSDGLGISDHDIVVATLVNQVASVEASNASTIKPGLVNQPIGKILITTVGDTDAIEDSTITIALDNGAKFQTGNITNQITVTGWGTYAASPTGATSKLDAGKLVLTLGTASASSPWLSGTALEVIADSKLIDATNAGTGDIKASVSGTKAFSTLSGSVKVATSSASGATVEAVRATAKITDTVFTGRKGEALGDMIRIGEAVKGSLPENTSITFAADKGVVISGISETKYTTSPYASGNLVVSSSANDTMTATAFVTTASNARTAYDFDFTLDTTNATAGYMTMTVGGSAGAKGVQTLANIMDATKTSGGTPVSTSQSKADVIVPDITVTENAAGALVPGYIGFVFPSVFTLNTSQSGATVTVTGGPAAGIGTSVNVDATGNVAYVKVNTASDSTTGKYTITISGLKGATTANAKGKLSYTVGGDDDTTYTAAAFGSNSGAKPTSDTVEFAEVVNPAVPSVGAATFTGTLASQKLYAAANDDGLKGDIYIFTDQLASFWNGTSWVSTPTAIASQVVLGTHNLTYDVGTLPEGTVINIGHGVGLGQTVTYAELQKGSYTQAYVVTASKAAQGPGPKSVQVGASEAFEMYLNITNDDGLDPATDIAHEWLVFGAVYGANATDLYFLDDQGAITAMSNVTDPTTVTYNSFDHTKDAVKLMDLDLGALGLAAGDFFYYGYVYGKTGFVDFTDTALFSLENWVIISVK